MAALRNFTMPRLNKFVKVILYAVKLLQDARFNQDLHA